jgi:hypothetical protein
MIQAVLLFLVAMVAMAVLGRLKRGTRRAGRCPACGRHRIGKGACPCGKGA